MTSVVVTGSRATKTATPFAYTAAESWHPKVRKDRTSLLKLRRAERSFRLVVQRHLASYLKLALQHFESFGIPSVQDADEVGRASDQFLRDVDAAFDTTPFKAELERVYAIPLELGAALGAKDLPKGVRFQEDVLLEVDWDLLDPEVTAWLNSHSAELIAGVLETSRNRIRSQILQGIELGEARDTIMRRLEKVLDDIPRWRARMIAQTEIIQAHTQGALQVYKKSGVVKGKRWVDGQPNACPLCSALNGDVVPLDGFFNNVYEGPPRHPGCRCTIAATLVEPEEPELEEQVPSEESNWTTPTGTQLAKDLNATNSRGEWISPISRRAASILTSLDDQAQAMIRAWTSAGVLGQSLEKAFLGKTALAKAIDAAYEPIRKMLRAKYGNTITLYRSQETLEQLIAEGKPLRFLLGFADEKFARQLADRGAFYAVNVPIDKIRLLVAEGEGFNYLEFVVDADVLNGILPTGLQASDFRRLTAGTTYG